MNDAEVSATLGGTIASQELSTERVVTIIYVPQAVFRVRAVTRCSGSLPGTEAHRLVQWQNRRGGTGRERS